jgi:hypothetical protein
MLACVTSVTQQSFRYCSYDRDPALVRHIYDLYKISQVIAFDDTFMQFYGQHVVLFGNEHRFFTN